MMNETDYCKLKAELICNALKGKDTSAGLRALMLRALNYCKTDSDIEWLRVRDKTQNFTKAMPIKKAEKLISAAMNMEPIGDPSFSKDCEQKAVDYYKFCRMYSKKRKPIKVCAGIVFVIFFMLAVVGVWCGDKSGIFYGQQAISFFANGQEYHLDNAVRYNDYVRLDIPTKKGYDATGIIDVKTQKQLFDSTGKSLFAVSNRDLSDYDNCILEATYEPHVYTANVMNAKNVSLSSVTYTVLDKPEDILEEPQRLDGYVFDGWFTDAKYRKPFTGNFMDYADSSTPLVLYPHYSLDGWTLNWELNGGVFKEGGFLDVYTILSDVPLPNKDMVVREGYELKGWAMEGKIIKYFTPTIMQDAVLYAIWEPICYKITYELNSGVLDGAATSFTIEDEFLLESPIRKGYNFEGWYANKIFTKSAVAIEQGTIGDKTFYAKWSPIIYTICYQLNGGENNVLNPIRYTADKNVMLQKPQRNGYTFGGWLCGNEKVVELNAVENGSVELSALWEANEYTISIILNNGDSAYSKSIHYDEVYFIEQPIRKGYEFNGFTHEGTTIDMHGVYKYTKDITLYASYTPIVYTIAYEFNGGEPCSLNPTSYTAEKSIILPRPNRNGYAFTGWLCGDRIVTELNAAENGSVVLAAVWEANKYTITVNPNNGSEIYKQTVCYNGYYSIEQPIKRGYTFTGFSMSRESIDSVGQYMLTSDISVIANYRANQYTISYVSEATTIYTQQVTYDEPYALYNPKTRLNYEFCGWYTSKIGGNQVSDGVFRIDGNIVLYASWLKVLTINLESGNTYTVDNTIEKAYIIGNYTGSNGIMTGINIKISARDYALTVVLINAGFKASENCVAINCENSTFTLKLINCGTSYIEGGNGSNGADGASGRNMTCDNRNGSNGLDGQYAVNCGKIILEELGDKPSTLILKAGNGGNGGNGGVDNDRSRMWLNYTPDGGDGGNTKAALCCISYSINGATVEFKKGTAGADGKAGSRGDWWCSACYGHDGKKGSVCANDVEYK